MLSPAVQDTADEVRETDRVTARIYPCPEGILAGTGLAKTLAALQKPFRITFDNHPDPDVLVGPDDHRDTYLLCRELGHEYPELALAASIASPRGLDAEVLDDGLGRGTLHVHEGLGLEGGVADALETGIDPFVQEVAGDSLETGSLLEDLGIELDAAVDDVPDHRRARLASYLVLRLVQQGAHPDSARLLLSGRIEGELGSPRRLAVAAEALHHDRGPSAALSVLLTGDRGDPERFRREAVSAVRNREPVDDQEFRSFRVKKGPGLKAAKIIWRDLHPDRPVAVTTGDVTYGVGWNEGRARKLLSRADSHVAGSKWFAAEGLDLAEVSA